MRTVSWMSHPQVGTCMTESIIQPCNGNLYVRQFIPTFWCQKLLVTLARLKGREQCDVLDS